MDPTRLAVLITGDASALQKAAQGAVKMVESMRSKMESAGSAMGAGFKRVQAKVEELRESLKNVAEAAGKAGAIMSAGLTLPLAGLAKMGMSFNAMKESALISFTQIIGSADEAQAHLDDLISFTSKTPFELGTVVGASQKLQAMGVTAEGVLPLLAAIGDSAAAMGGDPAKVDQLTAAFGKMSAQGKITGETLAMIEEAGVGLRKHLAEELGTTTEDVTEKISKGMIDADTAMSAFVNGQAQALGGTGALMAKQSATFNGLLSTLKDTFRGLLGDVLQPTEGGLKSFISTSISLLERAREAWANMSEGPKQAVITFLGMAAAAGPLLGVLAGLAGALAFLMSPIGLVVGAVIGLGTAFAGNIGGVRDMLMPVLMALGSVLQVVGGVIFNVAQAVIPVLLAGLQAIAPIVMALVAGWAAFSAVMWVVNTATAAYTAILGAKATILGLVTAAQTALNAAMLANPVGIVVAAIVGLVAILAVLFVAYQKNVGGIQERMAGFKEALVEGFTSLGEKAAELWTAMWEKLKELVAAGVELIVSLVTGYVQLQITIWTTLFNVARTIWTMMVQALVALVSWLVQTVTAAVSAFIEWLTGAWEKLKEGLINLTQALVDGVVGAWTWLVTTVQAIVQAVVAFIVERWTILVNNLQYLIGVALQWIADTFGRWGQWIATFLGKLVTIFRKAITWIAETIGRGFHAAWDFVMDVLVKVGTWVGGFLTNLRDLFLRGIELVHNIVFGGGKAIWDAFRGFFSGILETAREWGSGLIEVVLSVVQGLADKLAAFLGFFGGAGESLAAGLKAAVGSGLDGILSGVSGFISRIKTAGGELRSTFGDWVSGAREKLGGFFDKVKLPSLSELKDRIMGGGGDGEEGGLAALLGETPTSFTKGGGGGGTSSAEDKDAKAKKAKAKKEKKPKEDKKPENIAQTMANTAKKVSEAIQEGLEALEALAGSPLPKREIWEPRLAELEAFLTESLKTMERVALAIAERMGVGTDPGTILANLDKVLIVEEIANAIGSMLAPLTDAIKLAMALADEDLTFPDQSIITALGDFVERVAAEAVAVAATIEGDSTEHLKAVGEALKAWVDLFDQAVGTALSMFDEKGVAKPVGDLMSMVPIVDAFLTALSAIAARFTAGLSTLGDAEAQATALEMSQMVAETFGAWVSLVDSIGAIALRLNEVLKVNLQVAETLEDGRQVTALENAIRGTLEAIGNAGAGIVASAMSMEQETREEALLTSQLVADTFGAWLPVIAGLGELVRSFKLLNKATDELEEVTVGVAGKEETLSILAVKLRGFLMAIGQAGLPFVQAALKAETAEAAIEAQAVSQTVAASFSSWGNALMTMVAAIVALEELPDENTITASMAHVGALLAAVQTMAGGMVRGEVDGVPYDLTKAPEKVAQDLALIDAVMGTLMGGIQLIGASIELVIYAAENAVEPVDVDLLGIAIRNVETIRLALTATAQAWATALEESDLLWEDVMGDLSGYLSLLELVVKGFQMAQDVRLEELSPVEEADVAAALENAGRVLSVVRLWARLWAAGLERSGVDFEELAQEVGRYGAMLSTVVDLFSTVQGIELRELTVVSSQDVSSALSNAETVLEVVVTAARAWAKGLKDARLVWEKVDEEVQRYASTLGGVLEVFGLAQEVKLEEATVLDRDKAAIILANVEHLRTEVQGLAKAWADAIRDAGRSLELVGEEVEGFTNAAQGAVSMFSAGMGLAFKEAPEELRPEFIETVKKNILVTLGHIQTMAAEWAQAIRDGDRVVQDVSEETQDFSKTVTAAVGALGSAFSVFTEIRAGNVTGDSSRAIMAIRRNIEATLDAMAQAFAAVETEEGRLDKAAKIAEVTTKAAEALSKLMDVTSLDKLLANPLVNAKLGSGFMTRVRGNRLEHLKTQVAEGIARAAEALIEGIQMVTIPEDLNLNGFDRLASAYERILDILERIADVTVDTDNIQSIIDAARLLVGGLPDVEAAAGTGSGGGTPGAGGGAGGAGVPGGGGPGGPIEPPTEPIVRPDSSGGRLTAYVENTVNVNLDGSAIQRIIERTLADQARVETNAPVGA